MELDHLVINTGLEMDAAWGLFETLGFYQTPRGYHSLGSINHLMMTKDAYLELVGVPTTGKQREDVLNSPIGLSGLVFRSDDAQATFDRLDQAGFAPREPILLERPVTIDGADQMARFHNVRMTSAEFPAGRVYFCQHLTPGLVWREEWLTHPNGFCGLTAMTVTAPDPADAAQTYARLTHGAAARENDGWTVSAPAFTLRFQEGVDAFADATLVFDSLEEIERRALACTAVDWDRDEAGGGVLTLPSLKTRVLCRQA
ncbi:MAG: VOC family protein [Roseovarius sp.]